MFVYYALYTELPTLRKKPAFEQNAEVLLISLYLEIHTDILKPRHSDFLIAVLNQLQNSHLKKLFSKK